MPSDRIQWFPGHMAKTRRMISESLSLVDLVFEIVDARIPISSKNPETDAICKGKPRIILMSKSSLADPIVSEEWVDYYKEKGFPCILCDFISGKGMNEIEPAVRNLMKVKLENYKAKGMSGKALRAMVIGIPNVGKSSFINKYAGAKKAKVEDRPGVTVDKQWVVTPHSIELLDMPGVLWPKFEDRTVGENLSMTGAINDKVVNTDEVAIALCGRLRETAPKLFCERYKLKAEDLEGKENWEVFESVGRKRGFLISGGEINYERTASALLDDFRSGKIGRISLEIPKTAGGENA
ncbi:MAG: ribosome biogenesis GTPase YlqF [Clostridia bacterium]|nr:ribosome biogenesis GTPase YlqF [Clostridia bacterium]